MTMDFVKWTVKNGVYGLRPYTGMEISILSINGDMISHTHAAHQMDMVCNGNFTQIYDTFKIADKDTQTWRVMAGGRRGVEKFYINHQTGFFDHYNNDRHLDAECIDQFRWAARRITGSAILNRGRGMELVKKLIDFCGGLNPGWHKKDVLVFINTQLKEMSHGR